MSRMSLRPASARPPKRLSVAPGDFVFHAGELGCCWRVQRGNVHLSRDECFAGLARAGELIGGEALAGAVYGFSARALDTVELEAVVSAEPADWSALERRAADIAALRGGPADARLRHLLRLLAPDATGVRRVLALPSLRDLAEITDLTQETVSRLIGRLRNLGALHRLDRHHAEIDFARLRPAVALVA